MRTTNLRFEPVDAGHGSCTGCAFYNDHLNCARHACIPFQFPKDHPLSNVDPEVSGIIWIPKEQP